MSEINTPQDAVKLVMEAKGWKWNEERQWWVNLNEKLPFQSQTGSEQALAMCRDLNVLAEVQSKHAHWRMGYDFDYYFPKVTGKVYFQIHEYGKLLAEGDGETIQEAALFATAAALQAEKEGKK